MDCHTKTGLSATTVEGSFIRAPDLNPDLVKAILINGTFETQRKLLWLLERRPLRRVKDQVRKLLSHESPAVRRQALATYAATVPEDAVSRCERILHRDQSALVRHQAILLLGESGDVEAVDILLESLESLEARSCRLRAFAALAKLTKRRFGNDERAWVNWWHNHRHELLEEQRRQE